VPHQIFLSGHANSVLQKQAFITPPPVGTGSGVLFSLDFFVCLFVSFFVCFFVSKITRKRLDRFA